MSNLLKLETQFNWEIWECALSYLEPIIDILRHFSEFNKFNTNWLNKFVSDLFNAINGIIIILWIIFQRIIIIV